MNKKYLVLLSLFVAGNIGGAFFEDRIPEKIKIKGFYSIIDLREFSYSTLQHMLTIYEVSPANKNPDMERRKLVTIENIKRVMSQKAKEVASKIPVG